MWSARLHFLPFHAWLHYAFRSGCTRLFLVVLYLYFYQLPAYSQLRRSEKSWSFTVQGGASGYYGDLSPRNLGILEQYFSGLRAYGGLSLEKRLSGHVSISASFALNDIYGSDYGFSSKGSPEYLRNLHFRNRVHSFYLLSQWDFVPLFGRYSERKLLRPYMGLGIGFLSHSPQARLPLSEGGDWVELRPLGTEGQLLNGGAAYAKWQFQAPVEVGLSIKLNNWIDLVPHIRYHFAFTDYLDDVSGAYVDAGLLGNPLAITLSDRSAEPIAVETGGVRDLAGITEGSYTGADGNTYISYHGIPQGVTRGDGLEMDRYWSAGLKLRFYLSGSPKNEELSKLYRIHAPLSKAKITRRIIPDEWVEARQRHNVSHLAINTPYSEVPSGFYRDGFLVTSDRPDKKNPKGRRNGQYYNIYYTPFADVQRGKITKPVQILSSDTLAPHAITRLNQLQAAALDNRGRKLVFVASAPLKAHQKPGKFTLYYSKAATDLIWEKPQPVPVSDWTASMAQPAFSHDGDTLFFVSEVEGGYGGTDIFYSSRQDSTWSKPQNLGSHINTSGNELYPYLHPDGTLYFASDGHPGFGGLDLFEAYRDSTGQYVVKNMGAPVNSKFNDFGLIVDLLKRHGYFASDRNGGDGSNDVYSLSVPQLSRSRRLTSNENLVEERLIMVEGVLKDQWSNRPIPNAYVTIQNEVTQKMRVVSTNSKGLFSFQASSDGLYLLSVNALGYKGIENQPLDSVGVVHNLTGSYEVKMELEPKAARIMTLKGRTILAGDGRPLSGAVVTLAVKGEAQNDSKQMRVDSTGEYTFRLQRNLKYVITASKEGFETASYEFSTLNRFSQRIIVNLELDRASE